MRRSSLPPDMSTRLTDAPPELTMKARPEASARGVHRPSSSNHRSRRLDRMRHGSGRTLRAYATSPASSKFALGLLSLARDGVCLRVSWARAAAPSPANRKASQNNTDYTEKQMKPRISRKARNKQGIWALTRDPCNPARAKRKELLLRAIRGFTSDPCNPCYSCRSGMAAEGY